MERIKGANILFKVNGKQFAGVTDDSFNLTPTIVESQTKDDGGIKHRQINGYEFDFSISGVMSIADTGDAEFLDNIEILKLAKAGTPVEFVYGNFKTNKGLQKGTALISGYSESSPADGSNGTYTLNLQSSSDLQDVTQ